jgi:serine phosphatase RsbU (regulator of sigma subunit)/pSer/pThr/pTyr-binding forkhead associated (FHA) protein
VPTLAIQAGADGHSEQGEFHFDRTIVIGRGGTADLALTDSSVSRRHAMVEREDGQWIVRDLASANGTFVNDRRVAQKTTLASGDVLRLGSVVIAYTDGVRARQATGETTAVRCRDDQALDSRVVLRVGAAEAAKASPLVDSKGGVSPWTAVVERFARITSMMFDERALLAFAVEELLHMLPGAERGFVMLWDAELDRFVLSAARKRSGALDEVVASQTLLREVLARKEAVLVVNPQSDRRYASADSILNLRMQTAVCAPILFQNEMFGVLQVDSTSSGTSFERHDLAVALALASQMAMALAYARVHSRLVERELVERDLALARKVQQHFLPPEPPEVPRFDFAVAYNPALAVGGDLYDFVTLGDGRLASVVGDVSGKGIAAALFAAKVMSDLRYEAAAQSDAAAILTRVNRVLAARDHEGMFVTLALAIINPEANRLTVASAGHPLPLVRDAAGNVTSIGRTGDSPLGLDANARFGQSEYEIDPGDSVVLYTDGVLEALDAGGKQYGPERLSALVGSSAPGAQSIVDAITADVRAFEKGRAQSDDVTVVCFKRSA